MIKSFEQNALSNLRRAPDKASIEFLDLNYDLSALLWEMLGDAGGNANIGLYNPEWEKQCDIIYETYVQDKEFRDSKPGAHALLRYAVYLCDKPNLNRCSHPADDIKN
jgi:hypothetical protein